MIGVALPHMRSAQWMTGSAPNWKSMKDLPLTSAHMSGLLSEQEQDTGRECENG
jgi:hypothetical protein